MSKRDPNEDRILDHNYDGIQEFDNPMPAWWVWIFWATIIFSVIYTVNVVPGMGSGKGRVAQYQAEVEKWASQKAAVEAAAPPVAVLDDAGLLALSQDPARVAAGGAMFKEKCTPCHLDDGGGSIGPNLTDDFWIHGNQPTQIYTVIDQGVLDKGMINWGATLKPEEMQSLVAFVLTLHGTTPATPKEPQGDKYEVWTPATAP